MNPQIIFHKTETGARAIEERNPQLSRDDRTAMIMIDGRRSVGDLMNWLRPLGIADDHLQRLEWLGLIEKTVAVHDGLDVIALKLAHPAPTALQWGACKRYIAGEALQVPGIKTPMFMLKLRRCADTDQLNALIEALAADLSKRRTPAAAARMRATARAILAGASSARASKAAA
ncbi:MAG: hypothetical protein ACKVQU_12685 [Burkholderiales bacterium]